MTIAITQPVQTKSFTHPAQKRPVLAYLTTEYPKTSHTFIRREIVELERRGYAVERISIRQCNEPLAEARDREEQRKTWTCLAGSKLVLLMNAMMTLATRPLRSAKALGAAIRMARRSDRGVLVHLAYLVEAAAVLRHVRARGVQHVHVHFGTNSAAVAMLMRMLGGPTYSVTVHGPNEFDAVNGLSLAEKLSHAAFIVAISDFCTAQIMRWLPAGHWPRVHQVRCTVGDEFFGKAMPVEDGCTSLVCVGRLSAQKGQLLLLEAFRRALDSGARGSLVLAGDGEMRTDVEAAIARLQLQGHVSITGWIDEARVRELLRNSRALVLPSFAEGLPVVIMEAMALARPVISTFVAGIPELVKHGENGWLVPAGNREELTAAIIDALGAPVERLYQMGCAGRERVRERHHIASEMDRLCELLDHYALKREHASCAA